MSSPKTKARNTAQQRIGHRATDPGLGNDVNSIIEGSNFSKLSQKDSDYICESILNCGIDPRSLAFEIMTRRVANLILSKQHKASGNYSTLSRIFHSPFFAEFMYNGYL